MPLDYHKIDRLERLLKLQDAYTHWQVEMFKMLSGQEHSQLPVPPPVIEYVPDYIRQTFDQTVLSELVQANEELLEWPRKGAVPMDFLERYEEFYHRFRLLREYVLMYESGFEKITGLKNAKEMEEDLQQEMVRLSRQGQVFALAHARMDDYEAIKASLGVKKANQFIKTIAQSIISCLRPLDDAYYPGENEFFLCMRQTDTAGGLRGFQRFSEHLDKQKVAYEYNDQQQYLSMTGCVAEPVEGGDIHELIEGLRRDLSSMDHSNKGSALTYREISPLERFIKKT